MGNLLFSKIIGPVNPKQPDQFFDVLTPFLRFNGLRAPDNNKKWIQNLYSMYSFLFRFIIMYLYVFSEIMNVEGLTNLKESSMILFLLLGQFSMIYKMEKFFTNRYRIKACVRALNDSENIPQNNIEDEIIRDTTNFIINLFTFNTLPMVFGFLASAALVLQPGFQLPVAAWYPFEVKKYPNYYFAFAYNYFGVLLGAISNVFIDFMIIALFLSTKAQIQRLGAAIENCDCENMQANPQGTIGLKSFILRHKQLLEFTAEIEDIFGSSMFCQFILTTFIICMTLLVISDGGAFTEIVPLMGYLYSMTLQMFLYCWSGNEVSLALDSLTQKIFSSSFLNFDVQNSKMLLIFMQRTLRPSDVKVGKIFRITLGLHTFMDILKSSYSYFTVLRNAHH